MTKRSGGSFMNDPVGGSICKRKRPKLIYNEDNEAKITADWLRERLYYNPDTGYFTWIITAPGIKYGRRAGYKDTIGYWRLKLKQIDFYAHRIAWLIQTGEWPKEQIDHRDGDRANNKWKNLRAASHRENTINKKATNSIGLKGVRKFGERFIASICPNRKPIYLGIFNTAEEAHNAYVEAAKELYGEFARLE